MLSQSAAALLLCLKSGYLAFPHGEEEIKSNWSEVESLTALVHANYQTTMQTSWLRMMYQLLVSKGTKINNNSSFRLPFLTSYPTTVKDLRRAPAKVSLPSIFSGQPLQEHREIPQIMKRKSSSTKRLMQSIKHTATSCHIELNYFYVFDGR